MKSNHSWHFLYKSPLISHNGTLDYFVRCVYKIHICRNVSGHRSKRHIFGKYSKLFLWIFCSFLLYILFPHRAIVTVDKKCIRHIPQNMFILTQKWPLYCRWCFHILKLHTFIRHVHSAPNFVSNSFFLLIWQLQMSSWSSNHLLPRKGLWSTVYLQCGIRKVSIDTNDHLM